MKEVGKTMRSLLHSKTPIQIEKVKGKTVEESLNLVGQLYADKF